MTDQAKLDAEQICNVAAHRISGHLYPSCERCDLSKDESKAYFVFRFMMRDAGGVQEIGRFTVLAAMIEDGIMSEQRLHAALWHTLGQIRGMV
jgi:hypothetical protein